MARTLAERISEIQAQNRTETEVRPTIRPRFDHASKYVPPATLVDAQRRYDAEVIRQKEIEAQLSNKNALDPMTGQRMDANSWHAWRARATGALRAATVELRRLKQSIREFQTQELERRTGTDLTDPMTLIGAAERLLRKLAAEGVELDADEQALIDALGRYRGA